MRKLVLIPLFLFAVFLWSDAQPAQDVLQKIYSRIETIPGTATDIDSIIADLAASKDWLDSAVVLLAAIDVSGSNDSLEFWADSSDTRLANLATWLSEIKTLQDSLAFWADSSDTRFNTLATWLSSSYTALDSLIDLGMYHDGNLDSLVILGDYHDTDLDSIIEMQTAIMADIDKLNNIYARLDSVYRCSWAHENVYFLKDATANDTTFLSTGWNIGDAGKIFLVLTGDSIAHTSTAPHIQIKSIQSGFWKRMYLQIDATDGPLALLTIADATNTYRAWVMPTFSTKFSVPPFAFGDSICVIYSHGDADAGTISLDNWYYNE